MGRSNFIVLVKLTAEDAATARALRTRISQVDAACRVAWFDHRGIGAFVSTDLRAAAIRDAVLPIGCAEERLADDLLILQLGPDWWAREESLADAWLGSHRTPVGDRGPRA